MYQGKIAAPATEVSEKYAFNATTMNRHILGKKYEGEKASSSGTRRPVAVKVTATAAISQEVKKENTYSRRRKTISYDIKRKRCWKKLRCITDYTGNTI